MDMTQEQNLAGNATGNVEPASDVDMGGAHDAAEEMLGALGAGAAMERGAPSGARALASQPVPGRLQGSLSDCVEGLHVQPPPPVLNDTLRSRCTPSL